MGEERDFRQLLRARWDKGCNVCIGLDTDPTQLPSVMPDVHRFNIEIIKATAPYACAFKPNAAFYEANGTQGWDDLNRLTTYVRTHYPEIPLLLDAKRGDNRNSNGGYVQGIFDRLGFDAVTVQPYREHDSKPLTLFRGGFTPTVGCARSEGSGQGLLVGFAPTVGRAPFLEAHG